MRCRRVSKTINLPKNHLVERLATYPLNREEPAIYRLLREDTVLKGGVVHERKAPSQGLGKLNYRFNQSLGLF
jgi:hypothetical protein